MVTEILDTLPPECQPQTGPVLLLAHGAGAGADSAFMTHFATELAHAGFRVVRFNFPYMAKTALDGKRRPPDRAPKLIDAFEAALLHVAENTPGPIIIGGKSMGGRIASMLAAERPGLPIAGLVCLGYPFHPPGKSEKLRVAHLPDVSVPSLIVQGERDPFGGRALLDTLDLPSTFELHFAPDGNHDLSPRKASGHSAEGNWAAAISAITKKFDSDNAAT